ncbi:MAG: trimeric intracellular cation channel family protein [Bacteroidia bacterium]|nr:trimeric intracellular cation channel family protein [Bacteroidia bacterium]NNJ56154.1 trimeric intracellular cation channel family protein [Bacteroidia bacterium]
MDWIYILNLAGVLVFAISGVLTAIDNDFDVVGASVIGFITALGGGTLRDLLIGETPVGWMLDTNYLWTVMAAVALSYLFKTRIIKLRKGMFLFDSMGLGLFAILGVQKTIAVGLDPVIAILMGMVSAVFGGVLRDVLSNIVPLIFRKEIYATACLIGGLVFLILQTFSKALYINMGVAMFVVFIIRYLAVKKKWVMKF